MIRQESAASRARKRDACDRCHEMKSRCHKVAGSASCIRCERSGAQCHFSEALRAGRPKKRATGSLKQEPSPSSAEASRSNDESSPLDLRLETSSAIVENGMDMLNFASPLPDLFVSPETIDDHMQTATSNSTFECWLSVNPSDTQIVRSEDHNMTSYPDSVQLGPITPDQFPTGSSIISSASSGIQSSRRNELDTSSVMSQESIAQQLLYLHSTLQRLLTVNHNGGVLTWDDTWTPQTAIEQIFITTDKLVAVMEELSLQSSPSTPESTSTRSSSSDIEHTKQSQSGTDSTSLLALSCYICALEVYQTQIDSMNEQVTDMLNESRNSLSNGGSDSSTRSASLSSCVNLMPVLNIGQFNLGMSPIRNIGVLLHLMQEMVERLQGAVQCWSGMQSKGDEQMALDADIEINAHSSLPERTGGRKDSVLGLNRVDGTRYAMSSVFDSVLVGVQARERMLRASMQEVKDMLKRST